MTKLTRICLGNWEDLGLNEGDLEKAGILRFTINPNSEGGFDFKKDIIYNSIRDPPDVTHDYPDKMPSKSEILNQVNTELTERNLYLEIQSIGCEAYHPAKFVQGFVYKQKTGDKK